MDLAKDDPKQINRGRESAKPRDDNPPSAHKERIREGGIEPAPDDPMKHEPLEESYGRRSGQEPEESGTPEEVTHPEPDPGERSRE
jgi:hypothetical protein